MKGPRCPKHGAMERRPAQTPEQRFCGAWWACRRCSSAILIPSNQLLEQLGGGR